MKKHLLALLLIIQFTSCGTDNVRNVNPYIPQYSFSFLINLNLPSNSGLNSPINPILVPDGLGSTVIMMKISDTDYRAWNSYCPNQSPTTCSKMTIKGLNAVCSCENIEYSIFDGVGTGAAYTMIPYQVEILGNNQIRVYN